MLLTIAYFTQNRVVFETLNTPTRSPATSEWYTQPGRFESKVVSVRSDSLEKTKTLTYFSSSLQSLVSNARRDGMSLLRVPENRSIEFGRDMQSNESQTE